MSAALLLSDPDGTAQRVAMMVVALAPERRAEAIARVGDLLAALAEVEGSSPVDAAVFALEMQRRIREAVWVIEVSGGGAGGRG